MPHVDFHAKQTIFSIHTVNCIFMKGHVSQQTLYPDFESRLFGSPILINKSCTLE